MLDVASYRLATHLGLAFVILGFIAWFVFELKCEERQLLQCRRHREIRLYTLTTWLTALAFVQILLGALVAGIDAGRTYTDWPLMSGGFIPPYPLDLDPVWRNFFEKRGARAIHAPHGGLRLACLWPDPVAHCAAFTKFRDARGIHGRACDDDATNATWHIHCPLRRTA